MRTRNALSILLVVAMVIATPMSAMAQVDATWKGQINGEWLQITGLNWTGGVPNAADATARFDENGITKTVDVNGQAITVQDMFISDLADTYDITDVATGGSLGSSAISLDGGTIEFSLGGYTDFNAAKIPASLEAHFAADQGVTLAGSAVTQWDDLSGNARHATGSAGTFTPDEINGLPAVKFAPNQNLPLGGGTFTAAGAGDQDYDSIAAPAGTQTIDITDGPTITTGVYNDGGLTQDLSITGDGTLAIAGAVDADTTTFTVGGTTTLLAPAAADPMGAAGTTIELGGGTFETSGVVVGSQTYNQLRLTRYNTGTNSYSPAEIDDGIDGNGLNGGLFDLVPDADQMWTGTLQGPVLGGGDNYCEMYSGNFTAPYTGVFNFQQSADDYEAIWMDINQNGEFEDGEAIIMNIPPETWNIQKTGSTPILTAGQVYQFAAIFREGGGGDWSHFKIDMDETAGINYQYIEPGNAAQDQWWSIGSSSTGAIDMATTDFEVTANSNIIAKTDSTATFGALTLTSGIVDVTKVGTNTTFGATSAAAGATTGVTANSALTLGALTIGAGADVTLGGTTVTAASVDLDTSATIRAIGNVDFTGYNEGAAATALTVAGTGNLDMRDLGAAAAAGTTFTTQETATLILGGDTPLGGSTQALNLDGGTIRIEAPAAISMPTIDISATNDAVLDAATTLTATFGSLTFNGQGILTTSGAVGGITFGDTTVTSATGPLGFDTEVDTSPGALTIDPGVAATIIKTGAADLVLDPSDPTIGAGGSLAFDVQEGALIAQVGSNPLGNGSAVSINGGEVVLVAKDAATDPTFDNPVTSTVNGGTLTAGRDGDGFARTVTIGSGTNHLTLDAGGTLLTQTLDGYTLNVGGNVAGAGNLAIGAGSTVTVAGTLDAGTVTIDGSLAVQGVVNVNDLIANTGGSYTGPSNLTVANTLTLNGDLDLSGATLVVDDADVTVSGGTLSVGATNHLGAGTPVTSVDLSDGGGLALNGASLTTKKLKTTGGTFDMGATGSFIATGDVTAVPAAGPAQLELTGGVLSIQGAGAEMPAGLQFHIDASDINNDGGATNPADGATVTNWADTSGNGNDAGNAWNAPVYNTAGPNGMPVVTFTNDVLSTTHNFNALEGYTMITVSRYTGGDNERVFGSMDRNWLFGYHSNKVKQFHYEGWVANGGGLDTDFHLHVGTITNDADPKATSWTDGNNIATDNTGSNNTLYRMDRLALGGWRNNSETSNSDIAEALIFEGVLSEEDINNIAGYLAAKYGLAGTGYDGALGGPMNLIGTDILMTAPTEIQVLEDANLGNLIVDLTDPITLSFTGDSELHLNLASTTLNNAVSSDPGLIIDTEAPIVNLGPLDLAASADPVINKVGTGEWIITDDASAGVANYTGTATINADAGTLTLGDTGLLGGAAINVDNATLKLSSLAAATAYTEAPAFSGDVTVLAGPADANAAAAADITLPTINDLSGQTLTLGAAENYSLTITNPVTAATVMTTGVGAVTLDAGGTATTVLSVPTGTLNVGPATTVVTPSISVTGIGSLNLGAAQSTDNLLVNTSGAVSVTNPLTVTTKITLGEIEITDDVNMQIIGSNLAAPTGTITASGAAFAMTAPAASLPADLQVHFDASTGVAVDGSNNVTGWADQSVNGRDATTTGGAPLLVAGGLNGLPIVEMRRAGGDDFLTINGNFFGKEIYSVVRSPNAAWDNYGATLAHMNGRNSNWGFENNNTTFHGNQAPAAVSRNGVPGANLNPITDWMILKVVVNDNDTNDHTYQIGRWDNGYSNSHDVAELLAFSRLLTPEEENIVGGYLAGKYGLASSYTGSLGAAPIDMPNVNLELAMAGPSAAITLTGKTVTLGDLTLGAVTDLAIAGTETASFNNVNVNAAASTINSGGAEIATTVRGTLSTGGSGLLMSAIAVNGDLTMGSGSLLFGTGADVAAKSLINNGGSVILDGASSLALGSSSLTQTAGSTTMAPTTTVTGVTAINVIGGSLTTPNVIATDTLVVAVGGTLTTAAPISVNTTAAIGDNVVASTAGPAFGVSGSDVVAAHTLTLNGGTMALQGEVIPGDPVVTAPTYRYYRMTVTKNVGNANYNQMSAMAYYGEGDVWIPATAGYGAPVNDGAGERFWGQANDNNAGTKFGQWAIPYSLTYDFGTPTTMLGYNWATANDTTPARNPEMWTIEGSDDDATWFVVDDRSASQGQGPTTTFTWAGTDAGAYATHTTGEVNGGAANAYSLGEITYGSMQASLPNTTLATTASSTVAIVGAVDTVVLGGIETASGTTLTIDSPAETIALTNLTMGGASMVHSTHAADTGNVAVIADAVDLSGGMNYLGDALQLGGATGDSNSTPLTLSDGAVIDWTFDGTGGNTSYLDVKGDITLDGTLTVNVLDGVGTAGTEDIFIMMARGTIFGDVGDVTIAKPAGWAWDSFAIEQRSPSTWALVLKNATFGVVAQDPGDTDGNRIVDEDDLANFKLAFGLGGAELIAEGFGFDPDFDDDGDADLDDFVTLRQYFGTDFDPEAPAMPDLSQTPEPATMSLLALGALAILRRRSRKA
jgi:fibronectin-binding autotransporter adhesin